MISAVATLSNIVILKETLPRVVEARAAAHAAKLQDEEQPLLQSNGKDPAAEPAADSEGAASVTDALGVCSGHTIVGVHHSPHHGCSACCGLQGSCLLVEAHTSCN